MGLWRWHAVVQCKKSSLSRGPPLQSHGSVSHSRVEAMLRMPSPSKMRPSMCGCMPTVTSAA